MSKRMYHPCHKLSVPSAKLFWCRHCMQMFEDAITRWKHSKQCRGSLGFKPKDQDGQVVQMYVKPDKVCYTTNLVPGQGVVHKPHVKKTSADLKCVICHAKFMCLDDMREHVKYPCHKYSEESDSEESDTDSRPASLKIRRVDSLENSLENTNTSTALAVLAEASKHVESLAHKGSNINQREIILGDTSVEVTPIYPHYQNIDLLAGQVVQKQEVVITSPRPFIRQDLEPVVVFIQSEDGQDLPESSLDLNTIHSCVKETVDTLSLGQILQVDINVKTKKTKYFAVGCNSTLCPIQETDIQQTQVVEIQVEEPASNTDKPSGEVEAKAGHINNLPPVVQTSVDTDLVEALNSDFRVVDSGELKQDHLSNIKSFDPTDIVVEEVRSIFDNSQVQGELNKQQTSVEHSYQSNQIPLRFEENIEHIQVSSQVNQAQQTTFQGHTIPQPPALRVHQNSKVNFGTLPIVNTVQSLLNKTGVKINNRLPTQLSYLQTVNRSLPVNLNNRIQLATEEGQTLSEVQVIEVPQSLAVSTDGIVTIDNTADLLNNLVTYPIAQNVHTMASGKQLGVVEDWFGFAELTDDTNEASTQSPLTSALALPDTSPGQLSEPLLQQNKLLTQKASKDTEDENEVVVPIISNKSGKTKYKVLARQKVEDEKEEKEKDCAPVYPKTTYYVKNNYWKGHQNVIKNIPPQKTGPVTYISDILKAEREKKQRLSDALKAEEIKRTENAEDHKSKEKIDKNKVQEKPGSSKSDSIENVNKHKTEEVSIENKTLSNEKCKSEKKRKKNILGKQDEELKRKKKSSDKHENYVKRTKKSSDKNENDVKRKKKSSDNDKKLKGECKQKERNMKTADNENKSKRPKVKEKKVEKSKEDKCDQNPVESETVPSEVSATPDNQEIVSDPISDIPLCDTNTLLCDTSMNMVIDTSDHLLNEETENQIVDLQVCDSTIEKDTSLEEMVEQTLELTEESMNTNDSSMVSFSPETVVQATVCDTDTNNSCISPCKVTINRDPSIENMHTDNPKSDNENVHCQRSDNEIDTAQKIDSLSDKGSPAHRRHSLDVIGQQVKPVDRQISSDDSKLKGIPMVYNPEHVGLRKSGRLKNAKCSSRYRGDYGIRAETYTKLLHSNGKINSDSATSDEDKSVTDSGTEYVSDDKHVTTDEPSVSSGDNVCKRKKSISDETVTEHKKAKQDADTDMLSDVADSGITDLSEQTVKLSNININCDEKRQHMDIENKGDIETETDLELSTGGIDTFTSDNLAKCSIKPVHICKCALEQKMHHRDENIPKSIHNKSNDIKTANSGNCLNYHACESGRALHLTASKQDNSMKYIEHLAGCVCCHSSVEQYHQHSEKQQCDNQEQVPCISDIPCTCDNITTDPVQPHTVLVEQKKVLSAFEIQRHLEPSCSQPALPPLHIVVPECHTCTTCLPVHSGNSPGVLHLRSCHNSEYVHSVGKSVKKKQNQISEKRNKSSDVSSTLELATTGSSPESSPIRGDPVTILEDLRLKLFEKAGAAVKNDITPKQFESQLISSKRKGSQKTALKPSCTTDEKAEPDDVENKSGRSTPRSKTPKCSNESNKDILHEVAQSLDIIQQAKRKADQQKGEKIKPKRQKFAQKKFMLRSMVRQNDFQSLDLNCNPNVKTTCDNSDFKTVSATCSRIEADDDNTVTVSENKCDKAVAESNHMNDSVTCTDTIGSSSENIDKETVCEKEKDSSDAHLDTKVTKITKPKPKLIKCQACNHSFKNKDLMRKHYPCRIRQTRTWSQNVLRPKRAFRRPDKKEEKFKCSLPKNMKNDGKSRLQLLTSRKTKFRRVKGKRRRRLYQLLQDLKEKRKVVHWPHLSVSYDNLNFKEQCMYKLGLFCTGDSSKGIENYTHIEMAWFDKHREVQKIIDTEENFKPIETCSEVDTSLNDEQSTTEQTSSETENVVCVNEISDHAKQLTGEVENQLMLGKTGETIVTMTESINETETHRINEALTNYQIGENDESSQVSKCDQIDFEKNHSSGIQLLQGECVEICYNENEECMAEESSAQNDKKKKQVEAFNLGIAASENSLISDFTLDNQKDTISLDVNNRTVCDKRDELDTESCENHSNEKSDLLGTIIDNPETIIDSDSTIYQDVTFIIDNMIESVLRLMTAKQESDGIVSPHQSHIEHLTIEEDQEIFTATPILMAQNVKYINEEFTAFDTNTFKDETLMGPCEELSSIDSSLCSKAIKENDTVANVIDDAENHEQTPIETKEIESLEEKLDESFQNAESELQEGKEKTICTGVEEKSDVLAKHSEIEVKGAYISSSQEDSNKSYVVEEEIPDNEMIPRHDEKMNSISSKLQNQLSTEEHVDTERYLEFVELKEVSVDSEYQNNCNLDTESSPTEYLISENTESSNIDIQYCEKMVNTECKVSCETESLNNEEQNNILFEEKIKDVSTNDQILEEVYPVLSTENDTTESSSSQYGVVTNEQYVTKYENEEIVVETCDINEFDVVEEVVIDDSIEICHEITNDTIENIPLTVKVSEETISVDRVVLTDVSNVEILCEENIDCNKDINIEESKKTEQSIEQEDISSTHEHVLIESEDDLNILSQSEALRNLSDEKINLEQKNECEPCGVSDLELKISEAETHKADFAQPSSQESDFDFKSPASYELSDPREAESETCNADDEESTDKEELHERCLTEFSENKLNDEEKEVSNVNDEESRENYLSELQDAKKNKEEIGKNLIEKLTEGTKHERESEDEAHICYEVDGVMISENLVTGVKSVVRNKAILTSSTESEEDSSSQVSLEIKNDSSDKNEFNISSNNSSFVDEEDSFKSLQNSSYELSAEISDDDICGENVDEIEDKQIDNKHNESDVKSAVSIIQYERNGILISENLQTGEKTVIEGNKAINLFKEESHRSEHEPTKVITSEEDLVESESFVMEDSDQSPSDTHLNIEKEENAKCKEVSHSSNINMTNQEGLSNSISVDLRYKYTSEYDRQHENILKQQTICQESESKDVDSDIEIDINQINPTSSILKENTEFANVSESESYVCSNDKGSSKGKVEELNIESDQNRHGKSEQHHSSDTEASSSDQENFETRPKKPENDRFAHYKQKISNESLTLEKEILRCSPVVVLERIENMDLKDISIVDMPKYDHGHSTDNDSEASFDLKPSSPTETRFLIGDLEVPPVLEKVEEEGYYEEMYTSTDKSEDSRSSGYEPPTLFPEEEASPSLQIAGVLKDSSEEELEVKFDTESKKPRSERHFLDVLGNVEEKDIPKCNSQNLNEKHDNAQNTQSIDEELNIQSKDDELIGRHFSDIVDTSMNSNKGKMSHLVQRSPERRDLTMAEIRKILKPKNENVFSKETLLKLRSDVACLLKNVKTPVKKDPAWLKRDSLTAYRRKRRRIRFPDRQPEKFNFSDTDPSTDNIEQSESTEELTDYESESSDLEYKPSSADRAMSDFKGADNLQGRTKTEDDSDITKGGIADNILQMLTSIEDKGNVAVNMSNLLEVLAKNLGFSTQNQDIPRPNTSHMYSDSDSDYSEQETEPKDKTTIQQQYNLNEFDEENEPPCIDDIPLPSDSDEGENQAQEQDSLETKQLDNTDQQENLVKKWRDNSLEDKRRTEYKTSDTEEDVSVCQEHQGTVGQNSTCDSRNKLSTADRNKHSFDKDNHIENFNENPQQQIETIIAHNLISPDVSSHPLEASIVSHTTEFQAKPILLSSPEPGHSPNHVIEENDTNIIAKDDTVSLEYKQCEFEKLMRNEISKDRNYKQSHDSTIFKSITELNSILTDSDDSNPASTYDAVSISRRMFELKALSDNSDVISDMSDLSDNENSDGLKNVEQLYVCTKTLKTHDDRFGLDQTNDVNTTMGHGAFTRVVDRSTLMKNLDVKAMTLSEKKLSDSAYIENQSLKMSDGIHLLKGAYEDAKDQQTSDDEGSDVCNIDTETSHHVKVTEHKNIEGPSKSLTENGKEEEFGKLTEEKVEKKVISDLEEDIIVNEIPSYPVEENLVSKDQSDQGEDMYNVSEVPFHPEDEHIESHVPSDMEEKKIVIKVLTDTKENNIDNDVPFDLEDKYIVSDVPSDPEEENIISEIPSDSEEDRILNDVSSDSEEDNIVSEVPFDPEDKHIISDIPSDPEEENIPSEISSDSEQENIEREVPSDLDQENDIGEDSFNQEEDNIVSGVQLDLEEEKNANEVPSDLDEQNIVSEVQSDQEEKKNVSEILYDLDEQNIVSHALSDREEEKNRSDVPSDPEKEENASDVPSDLEKEKNRSDVPSDPEDEENASDVPSDPEKEENASDVPSDLEKENNRSDVPSDREDEENASDIPSDPEKEENASEVPSDLDEQNIVSDVPSDREEEKNVSDIPSDPEEDNTVSEAPSYSEEENNSNDILPDQEKDNIVSEVQFHSEEEKIASDFLSDPKGKCKAQDISSEEQFDNTKNYESGKENSCCIDTNEGFNEKCQYTLSTPKHEFKICKENTHLRRSVQAEDENIKDDKSLECVGKYNISEEEVQNNVQSQDEDGINHSIEETIDDAHHDSLNETKAVEDDEYRSETSYTSLAKDMYVHKSPDGIFEAEDLTDDGASIQSEDICSVKGEYKDEINGPSIDIDKDKFELEEDFKIVLNEDTDDDDDNDILQTEPEQIVCNEIRDSVSETSIRLSEEQITHTVNIDMNDTDASEAKLQTYLKCGTNFSEVDNCSKQKDLTLDASETKEASLEMCQEKLCTDEQFMEQEPNDEEMLTIEEKDSDSFHCILEEPFIETECVTIETEPSDNISIGEVQIEMSSKTVIENELVKNGYITNDMEADKRESSNSIDTNSYDITGNEDFNSVEKCTDTKINDDDNVTTCFNELSKDILLSSHVKESGSILSEKENVPLHQCPETLQQELFESDYQGMFFETIAEKVKRKQRERLQRQSLKVPNRVVSFKRKNSAVKQISIFRSSMLDRRIRQNSLSSMNIKLPSKKSRHRSNSVPKEMKLSSMLQIGKFKIKPCSVKLNKLEPSIIQRYCRRGVCKSPARSIDRPPIKLRIKLSDIIMPCSPYSTFTESSTEDEFDDNIYYSPGQEDEDKAQYSAQLHCSIGPEKSPRAKSVDNISPRVTPLRINMKQLMMSKSKSLDYKCDSPTASDTKESNVNKVLAKQICSTSLQLSESDTDDYIYSDDDFKAVSDTAKESPKNEFIEKTNYTISTKDFPVNKLSASSIDSDQTSSENSNSETVPSLSKPDSDNENEQGSEIAGASLASWTKITFQKGSEIDEGEDETTDKLIADHDNDDELNKILQVADTIPNFSSVTQLSPHTHMGASAPIADDVCSMLAQRQMTLGQHQTNNIGFHGTLPIERDSVNPNVNLTFKTGLSDIYPDSDFTPANVINSDIKQIEAEKAALNLENEKFNNNIQPASVEPGLFKFAHELANVETFEAVQALETVEFSEIATTAEVVINPERDSNNSRSTDLVDANSVNQTVITSEVVVNDRTNKYVYGVSEESQSSADLVEEQVIEETVTDISMEDNTVGDPSLEQQVIPSAQSGVNRNLSQLLFPSDIDF